MPAKFRALPAVAGIRSLFKKLGWRQLQIANDSNKVTIELPEAFADVCNRHDVDALMSFMTEDCVFESSGGQDNCGTRYEGVEAVRKGYTKAWADFPEAQWNNARHFIQGDRGVSEWMFAVTNAEGKRSEGAGCDLFTFRDGKILVKNSFRKNRPLI